MISRYYIHIFLCIHMFLIGNVIISATRAPETTPKASSQNFNFELYNKLPETIWIRLKYFDGNNIFSATEIKPMGKIRAVFSYKNDQPVKLDLAIWNRPKAEKSKPILNKWLKPCVQAPCKKTLYITLYNESGNYKLKPQTGTYLGLSGKTDSGLSKANNVKNLIPPIFGNTPNIGDI